MIRQSDPTATSWWGNPTLYPPDYVPPIGPRMAPPAMQPFDPYAIRAEWMGQYGTAPRPPQHVSPAGTPTSQMPSPPPPVSGPNPWNQGGPRGLPPVSQPSSPAPGVPPLEIGQRGSDPFPPFPQQRQQRSAPQPPPIDPARDYIPGGATFQYDPAVHGPTNTTEMDTRPYQGRTPYEPSWGGGYIFLDDRIFPEEPERQAPPPPPQNYGGGERYDPRHDVPTDRFMHF